MQFRLWHSKYETADGQIRLLILALVASGLQLCSFDSTNLHF